MKNIFRTSVIPLFLVSASCHEQQQGPAQSTGEDIALSHVDPVVPKNPLTKDAAMAAWAALETGKIYDLSQHSSFEKPIIVLDLGHGERYGQSRTVGAFNAANQNQNEVSVIDAVAENLIEQLEEQGFTVFTTRAPGKAFRFYNNQPDAPDLFSAMRPYRMLEGEYTNRVNRSLRARMQYAYSLQHLLNSPYMVVLSLHTESESEGKNTSKPKIIVQSDDTHRPDLLSLKLGETIEKHYDFPSLGQPLWRHEDLAILSEAAHIRENSAYRLKLRDHLKLPEDNPLSSAALLLELGNYNALTKVSAASMAEALTKALTHNIEQHMNPPAPEAGAPTKNLPSVVPVL